jgi:hypothetical protein
MEQLSAALISNRAKNSPASKRKSAVTYPGMQKIGSSHDAFFKDPPDCAPILYNKKKTVMFATNLASFSAISAHYVSATEHSDVWYTSKELAEISNLAKLARQSAWMLGEEETNVDECFRGLENLI